MVTARKNNLISLGGLLFTALMVAAPLFGQLPPDPVPPPTSPNTITGGFATLTGYLRAKASGDECWAGLGLNTQWQFPNQANPSQPCPTGQIPKVNQGYIWGSTKVGNLIFFGTVANPDCIGAAAFGTSNPTPFATSSWTCEFADSPYSTTNWKVCDPQGTCPVALPSTIADFRPARYYAYNVTTHAIKDITPKLGGSPGAYCGPTNLGTPLCVDSLWSSIEGIRTSTPYTDPNGHTYILVSGPALPNKYVQALSLAFFALDITGITDPSQITNANWVAEFDDPDLMDQRHWISYGGYLYAPSGKPNKAGGAVMQYTGNFSKIPTITPGPGNAYQAIPFCGTRDQHFPAQGTFVCFAFQDVGDLPDGPATDAVLHTEINPNTGQPDTRIYVVNWPPPGVGGLYMSPQLPPGGLAQANPSPTTWKKIWQYTNYDPDPFVAPEVGMGALADFQGTLYFGTMVYPYAGTAKWLQAYDANRQMTGPQILTAVVNTFRSATLFSSNNLLSASPTINLLYGQKQFNVWNGQPGTQGAWVLTNNNMGGVAPQFGVSGFGNPYNNYVWTMAVFNNKLYVGTMDWGFPAADAAPLIIDSSTGPAKVVITELIPPQTYGGDIYSFSNTTSPALAETISGGGNYTNYGFRGMMVNGSTSMFVGTANPMNIATVNKPNGGWELIELVPTSQQKGR